MEKAGGWKSKEGRELFWQEHNKPFLDKEISAKRPFKMIDKPSTKNMYYDVKKGQEGLNFFGREVEYLKKAGYTWDPKNWMMIPPK